MKNKNGISIDSKVPSKRFKKVESKWVPESNPFSKYAEIELKDAENCVYIILPYVWTNIQQYLNEGWVLKGSWSK